MHGRKQDRSARERDLVQVCEPERPSRFVPKPWVKDRTMEPNACATPVILPSTDNRVTAFATAITRHREAETEAREALVERVERRKRHYLLVKPSRPLRAHYGNEGEDRKSASCGQFTSHSRL
jgi:hypothetical protein